MSTGAKFIVSATAFWVAAGVVGYYVFSRAIVKKRPTYFANIYMVIYQVNFLSNRAEKKEMALGGDDEGLDEPLNSA